MKLVLGRRFSDQDQLLNHKQQNSVSEVYRYCRTLDKLYCGVWYYNGRNAMDKKLCLF